MAGAAGERSRGSIQRHKNTRATRLTQFFPEENCGQLGVPEVGTLSISFSFVFFVIVIVVLFFFLFFLYPITSRLAFCVIQYTYDIKIIIEGLFLFAAYCSPSRPGARGRVEPKSNSPPAQKTRYNQEWGIDCVTPTAVHG